MITPIAFLEKAGSEWLDDFVYIARQPLIDRGYDIVEFDEENMEEIFTTKRIKPAEDVIVASVNASLLYFKISGITIPEPLGYPESLNAFLGREIIKTTFGQLGEDFPYFAKPAGEVKLFIGDEVKTKMHLAYIADEAYVGKDSNTLSYTQKGEKLVDMPVYKSTLIDFVSEYRCFISYGEIKGVKHYKGNFLIFPNPDRIKEMVEAYKDCPSAYTLDVGVASDGETYLVEVNDMWAIGSYGFNGRDYALMCARRMREIYNNSNSQ